MSDVDLENLSNDVAELRQLLEKLIESHNQVGGNIQWLVANTEGIFRMMQDPNIINQMMGGLLGGKMPKIAAEMMGDGGRPEGA